MLAVAAQSDPDLRTERVCIQHRQVALTAVMRDADGCMNRPLFHGLGARSEHAHGEFEITVNDMAKRKARWSLVIEKTEAGRETEHRQNAAIGEPFAQSLLHEAWVSRSGRNLRYEGRSDPSKSYSARALVASQSRPNHERVVNGLY